MKRSRAVLFAIFAMTSFTALAADYPAPRQGDWIARDFRFRTGETMPELRFHHTTVGEPSGQLVPHGSGGSSATMLTPTFAGELFGPASRSMRRNTTSSFPTPSATANPQSRPTA